MVMWLLRFKILLPLFASAILVNQKLGGNISQTLDRLAGSLESIEHMRREVHAATSEGRTNIKVLAIAPSTLYEKLAKYEIGT